MVPKNGPLALEPSILWLLDPSFQTEKRFGRRGGQPGGGNPEVKDVGTEIVWPRMSTRRTPRVGPRTPPRRPGERFKVTPNTLAVPLPPINAAVFRPESHPSLLEALLPPQDPIGERIFSLSNLPPRGRDVGRGEIPKGGGGGRKVLRRRR